MMASLVRKIGVPAVAAFIVVPIALLAQIPSGSLAASNTSSVQDTQPPQSSAGPSAGTLPQVNVPEIEANRFASADTIHQGTDYGAILTAAAKAQAHTATCVIRASQGTHSMYTPAIIKRSCELDLRGARLEPKCGSDSPAAWCSSPVTIENATLTAGSQRVTYSATKGIVGSMAIGGIGMPNANYVLVSPAPTATSLTTALPQQLMFTGIVTNGSATIKGVSSMRGLIGGSAQSAEFPAIPSGAEIPWSWAGGGSSAAIVSVNAERREVTFSAPIKLASNLHTNSPVTFTLSAGSKWTSTLTAQQVAAMIQVVPGDTTQPKWQGYRIEGGIVGGWLVDPAFSPRSAGRSVTGVQGLQIVGYDGFKLRDFRVNGLTGSALVVGGNDYGGTLCPASNAYLGSLRESNFSGLQLWESGDWKTGQPEVEIAGMRCWNGTASAPSDQPNELTITGSKMSSSWGPALVITSFNTNIWAGKGNPPNNIFFTADQFEGGGRTGAPGAPPSRSIDIQNAGTINFIGDEVAVPVYGYCLFCVDKANSLVIQSTNWGTAGNGDYAAQYNIAISHGDTTATYVSGGYPAGGFPATGEWDDQPVKIRDRRTAHTTYASFPNAVGHEGKTLKLSEPFAGESCSSESPCSLSVGFGGYPLLITQSLSNLWIGGTTITVSGRFTDNFLDPGGAAQKQDLFVSGSCPGTGTVDILSFTNTMFCAYAALTTVWGSGPTLSAGGVAAPNLRKNGDLFQFLGQSNVANNALWAGVHFDEAQSPSNYGFSSFGGDETSYNAKYFANGTTFPKAVAFDSTLAPNAAAKTLNGNTAGTYTWVMPQIGSAGKLVWLTLAGYENSNAAAQSIALPVPFGSTTWGIITLSGSCAGVTVDGANITLPSRMRSAQSGFCKIEGY